MRHVPIWGLAICSALVLAACHSVSVSEQRWERPFADGSFEEWIQRGGNGRFFMEEDVLVGETVKETPNSFLCSPRSYSDFELEFEVLVDESLNSGVQIRSESRPDYKDGRVHGYQVEIDPSQKPHRPSKGRPTNRMADGSPAPPEAPRSWSGGIYDEGRRGWLQPLTHNPEGRAAFKPGQWNQFRVKAVGNTIKTWVNDVPCSDLEDDMTTEGFIAFQVHSSRTEGLQVRWRNVRVREL